MEQRWHYAVYTGGYYMVPACDPDLSFRGMRNVEHGITINRGDVNCSECKRMMGMP